MRRTGRILLIVLVAAVAAAVIGFGARYLVLQGGGPSSTDIDRGVQAVKDMPLVRVVIAENPELEDRLRAAIAEDLKGDRPSPPSSAKFGVEVRQRYIVPTLLRADDDSALKAARGMETLATYLQAKNVSLCRELGMVGLQNANKLDSDGTILLRQALSLQEDAYRSGKTGSPRTPLKTEEIGSFLGEAGYGEKDLAQLNAFATLPAAEACAATVKLYAAPRTLPVARGGMLARWLLTVGQ